MTMVCTKTRSRFFIKNGNRFCFSDEYLFVIDISISNRCLAKKDKSLANYYILSVCFTIINNGISLTGVNI